MKKIKSISAFVVLLCIILSGCANQKSVSDATFNDKEKIVVFHREKGSGTRENFIECLGVEESKLKETEGDFVSGTDVMLAAVESDKYSIGYVSYGQVTDNVKVLKVNGIQPDDKTIKNNTYPFVRNLYLVTKESVSEVTEDFLNFAICNEEIVKEGFVETVPLEQYKSTKPEGKVRIGGSSSLYPLLNKIKEHYLEVNPNADIEINQTDSTDGIKNVSDDIVNIAMVSREMSQDEMSGKKYRVIAKDAIAVITNILNPKEDISVSTLKDIYVLERKTWEY